MVNNNPQIYDGYNQAVPTVSRLPTIMCILSQTYSTPVDPIELKKRLADLLIQRSAKGDQQAMELKVPDRLCVYP